MEAKKTPKADLERKRTFFVQIGLIVALAAVLVAFEWKTYDKQQLDLGARQVENIEDEMIEITQQNKPPPPPAPPPTTTLINIVQDDVEVEDDISIDAEASQLTEIPAYVPPAVTEEEEVAEAEIFMVVEDAPSFPGGDEARIRFLQQNIKYPQMARESSIQGTVYVTFVVERDGSVTDVRVLRGIGGGCDEEAIRVIKAMPKWNPGKQRGKPVRVQFNMPIKFTLAG
ncbi:protein containing TonB family C-terminal domain [Lentimicrobium saccharophilum]|uniref:Protein containing TonB family C-terminal domain n=1 Tax=Lentimicrobium saccharophilum TaxID=1678841 RepID=A0A0S7BNJ2_9BACT|nr:energy transducer TonB [Lentimicrobium saccharophilum]GAP42085.1 protein containing TonB family C-terminal domain [Lentimicrobium saccharophilum]